MSIFQKYLGQHEITRYQITKETLLEPLPCNELVILRVAPIVFLVVF
ncbi:hypothetical protein MUDAN_BIHEEGNE_03320 [Lactiplantibacillus mudanjiangensis]|uniref:Uncharacterized protein n=1 Tax=Lactiplantibacillus mudanjiangensis TaxID=1296538 RepID=A0A660E8S0_9LACO|nr:hypothetical protein MUDAN_BIHEEGNE_03320 [Lactiplantibacillus mudanjiangensis]VDG25951.1 hypothetical protein MUDAN_IGPPGNFN_01394 [Lactiplantibacillus mudanjiangensis]VDG28825.1 hypothetical protein MUDAN_MDHGFNIF_03230 [Lactiplantibacillus mudanjiangensis]VDG33786.1 hypothetical protein MUDAN_DOGOELCO_02918 [Lactiplantibacillus mudanjiangensis]